MPVQDKTGEHPGCAVLPLSLALPSASAQWQFVGFSTACPCPSALLKGHEHVSLSCAPPVQCRALLIAKRWRRRYVHMLLLASFIKIEHFDITMQALRAFEEAEQAKRPPRRVTQ